jgi:hypothetical protein
MTSFRQQMAKGKQCGDGGGQVGGLDVYILPRLLESLLGAT